MPVQPLPPLILQKLSPIAAKLYLLLLFLADHSTGTPLVRVSIDDLVDHSALPRRTCQRALAELRHATLLESLPRSYHQTHVYVLPFAQHSPTTAPPVAHNNAHARPYSPPSPVPPSRTPQNTPRHAPKNPKAPSMAQLLNMFKTLENGATDGAQQPSRSQFNANVERLLHEIRAQSHAPPLPPLTPPPRHL